MEPTDTPFGSICDIEGVGVGHHQRTGRGWQSGTTVVTVAHGATPGVDVRGGGPGTRETDAIRPGNLIRSIQAVTLTGGSAYGLAAADGVVDVLEQRGLGFPVADHVVPVVPAAVIFDLGRGGDVRNRPDRSFGSTAARRALDGSGSRRWGAVGAGAGAIAGGLQGGVGTAVTDVDIDGVAVGVGAVAVVNSNGSPIDPATALPWETHGLRLRRPTAAQRREVVEVVGQRSPSALNTTIGVVATSAALDPSECGRIATAAHDGLARSIRPAHAMTDGDTVFALATGADEIATTSDGDRVLALNSLLSAAAQVFSAACTHALISSDRLGDAPAWRELCEGAARRC